MIGECTPWRKVTRPPQPLSSLSITNYCSVGDHASLIALCPFGSKRFSSTNAGTSLEKIARIQTTGAPKAAGTILSVWPIDLNALLRLVIDDSMQREHFRLEAKGFS